MKILYGLLIILVIVLFITQRHNYDGFVVVPANSASSQAPAPGSASSAASSVAIAETAIATAAAAAAATVANVDRECTVKATTDSIYSCAPNEYITRIALNGTTTTYSCCPVITGLTGPDGLRGPQGLTGTAGPRGPPGTPGLQGFPGDRGEDGPKGFSGPKGKKGPKGPNGQRGPRGASGLDAKLDPIIVKKMNQDGTITQVGPEGPIGDEGPRGPAGIMGPAGLNYTKPNDNELIFENIDYRVDSENVSDAVERTIHLVALQRNAKNMLSSLSDPRIYQQRCPVSPALAQGSEFSLGT
jgi:hypothetical protein